MANIKDFSAVEVCRELSKAIKEQIADYERELSDLRQRELKKNTQEGYVIPGGDGGMAKGETFIDIKNDSTPGKRLKDVGLATPKQSKPKQVTPKNHDEGGNDGDCIKPGKSMTKGSVPMAKPPSGGTGIAPKAPSMAKPAAPAGGMPKPPMMAKGGARMDNPTVKQSASSINTMAKAINIPGRRPAPGSVAGDAAQASFQKPGAAPAPAAKATPKPPSDYADFTPAGAYTAAGKGLPPEARHTGRVFQAKKPISIPGKGPVAQPATNPAAAHLQAPPAAVRPSAPAPHPAPARKPMGKEHPSMPPEAPVQATGAARIPAPGARPLDHKTFGKSEANPGATPDRKALLMQSRGQGRPVSGQDAPQFLDGCALCDRAQGQGDGGAAYGAFGACPICGHAEHAGLCL